MYVGKCELGKQTGKQLSVTQGSWQSAAAKKMEMGMTQESSRKTVYPKVFLCRSMIFFLAA